MALTLHVSLSAQALARMPTWLGAVRSKATKPPSGFCFFLG
ncbi:MULTISPECIES: hypothetical protein [Pseudomonas]|nr:MULTISPECIES: hypothetical protein [Pseudomonas]